MALQPTAEESLMRYCESCGTGHECEAETGSRPNPEVEIARMLSGEAHDAAKTAEHRRKAAELLAAIDADTVVAEYLALPENVWDENGKHPRRGQPKYQNFDELATWVLGWLVWAPGESKEAIHSREDRLRADKLGVVIRAQRLAAARPRRTCDCDVVRIVGDCYHLAVPWCAGGQPHLPKEI